MLWSGSDPRTVMRDSMWRFLMFAGVAWLAIAWSVLRLEPENVAGVAGPVILFGALCEGVRALAGTRTWWLNAGMAGLFAVTGVVVLAVGDATFATPAALVGWYLMVRGAVDVSVSTMNRGTDRTWGLLLTLGVAQTGLGFFAAGPLARTVQPVVLVLGGLGVLRAVADLVTALRLREVTGARHDVLKLPPERAAGVAGYAAGLTDYDEQPKPDYEPHPHAEPQAQAQAQPDRQPAVPAAPPAPLPPAYDADSWQGPATEAAPFHPHPDDEGRARHRAEGPAPAEGPILAEGPAPAEGPTLAQTPGSTATPGHAVTPGWTGTPNRAETPAGWTATTGPVGTPAGWTGTPGRAYHDEVVRATRDLDSTIAQAGVIGTGAAAHRIPDDLPAVPDTVEGAAEAADHRR
jgi:uncharacterized membrane protein HdeD (DUF308 family)